MLVDVSSISYASNLLLYFQIFSRFSYFKNTNLFLSILGPSSYHFVFLFLLPNSLLPVIFSLPHLLKTLIKAIDLWPLSVLTFVKPPCFPRQCLMDGTFISLFHLSLRKDLQFCLTCIYMLLFSGHLSLTPPITACCQSYIILLLLIFKFCFCCE